MLPILFLTHLGRNNSKLSCLSRCERYLSTVEGTQRRVEIVLDRGGLLTNTFDSLPKAPSCEGMALGGRETTGRLNRLDRDNRAIHKKY